MNQSMFLCVYVSIPSVMLLVLLLGLEPVIKFIYIRKDLDRGNLCGMVLDKVGCYGFFGYS